MGNGDWTYHGAYVSKSCSCGCFNAGNLSSDVTSVSFLKNDCCILFFFDRSIRKSKHEQSCKLKITLRYIFSITDLHCRCSVVQNTELANNIVLSAYTPYRTRYLQGQLFVVFEPYRTIISCLGKRWSYIGKWEW